MQSNFWAGSKNLDRHKTFVDLWKDKAQVTKHDPNFSILKLIVEKILELIRLEIKTPTCKSCASYIKIVFVGKVIDKFTFEGKYSWVPNKHAANPI